MGLGPEVEVLTTHLFTDIKSGVSTTIKQYHRGRLIISGNVSKRLIHSSFLLGDHNTNHLSYMRPLD